MFRHPKLMNKKNKKIYIIGAGVSGLTAAICLEKEGYSPVLIESTNDVGGRVKTEKYKGFFLDHGFQVLLTSYPLAKKYLNYNDLNLQKLMPGSLVLKNGLSYLIGDPFRRFGFLFPTVFSKLLSFKDKLKILKLKSILKKKSIEEIFDSKETSTMNYLKNFGFSQKAIQNFFIPFFGGVFLENKLETSSRMFEFIYKMFESGDAAIPKYGIGAIAQQLKHQLKKTKFIFNTEVISINEHQIHLKGGKVLDTDYSIVTIHPRKLIKNYSSPSPLWKSCKTLYFITSNESINKPLIGLNANKKELINNLFFHTSIENNNERSEKLLSVTIIKDHNLNSKELIDKVTKELESYGICEKIEFLKSFDIKFGLPIICSSKNSIEINKLQHSENIFLAGDYLLNGSLNAAMYSGEQAALNFMNSIS